MTDSVTQSLQLAEQLARLPIAEGGPLDRALRLGGDVSLWEAIAPYLTFYRFPPLFSQEGWRARWARQFGSYRAIAGQVRDRVSRSRFRDADGCPQWSRRRPTVLLLGFWPSHYRDVLQSVAESLALAEHLNVVVLAADREPLESQGQSDATSFQSVWQHWNRAVAKDVDTRIARLRTVRRHVLRRDTLQTFVEEAQVGVDPAALRREFAALFRRDFRRLVTHTAFATHILDCHRPALVVYTDETDPRSRVYSLLARHRDIPTLAVQQGLASPAYPEWHFLSARAIAVMGESSRQILLAQGVSSERIVITGHPGFDRLVDRGSGDAAAVRSTLGITTGEPMVLFASQPPYAGAFRSPAIRREMIAAVASSAAAVAPLRLVVKPHPGEDERELRAIIGTHARITIVDREVDISPLIKACDVLITFFSQTALQALFISKPVINVAFPDSGGATLYVDSEATWVARSAEEIAQHLRNLTTDASLVGDASKEEARQRFVRDWAYVPDGRASERVSALAARLVGQ